MSNFKKISKNISELTIGKDDKKIKWLNITNVKKAEIGYLRKNFSFSLSHLRASSSQINSQRPVINHTEKYSFLILHFPSFHNDHITSEEIEFFIGDNYVITLHDEIETLNSLFKSTKKDSSKLLSHREQDPKILLYEIIKKLLMDSYIILDDNSLIINETEELIFDDQAKKAVAKILLLRRNIINLSKSMRNHTNIIKSFIKTDCDKKTKEYYQGLLIDTQQIWDLIESQKEMVEILNNTNESLLNDRISDIMKTLTIFSVIVFPLTLLAGIFGMNLENGMPFINTENGFWVIIAVMFVGCLGMILFFKRKNWI